MQHDCRKRALTRHPKKQSSQQPVAAPITERTSPARLCQLHKSEIWTIEEKHRQAKLLHKQIWCSQSSELVEFLQSKAACQQERMKTRRRDWLNGSRNATLPHAATTKPKLLLLCVSYSLPVKTWNILFPVNNRPDRLVPCTITDRGI